MTQAERDRLVVLTKAKKGLLTQKAAAEELKVSERQVRRMIERLKRLGDKSVIHALKGKASNRRIDEKLQNRALEVLGDERCHDFGPTYARDHLAGEHSIEVSKETVRQWMIEGGRWRAGRKKPEKNRHVWRERRGRFGELVQWDTSDHDWLEGRGSERIYLILMIDDATSRVVARFAPHDSTEENMRLLEMYLQRLGRPEAFYTDQASLFQTALKTRRGESRETRDEKEMEPTQIGRALRELGVKWIGAHSPQAKGRVERSFLTGQDRLVKDMRMAAVTTLEQANQYLETHFLPWWEKHLAVEPREPENAHRTTEKEHDLAAILSHVESRIVKTDYTFQIDGRKYVIERADIRSGMRGASVRIEKRRDGVMAVRFEQNYVRYRPCDRGAAAAEAAVGEKEEKPLRQSSSAKAGPAGKSTWMKTFDFKKVPSLEEAIAISNAKG